MKRVMASALILALILGAVGCGEKKDDNASIIGAQTGLLQFILRQALVATRFQKIRMMIFLNLKKSLLRRQEYKKRQRTNLRQERADLGICQTLKDRKVSG